MTITNALAGIAVDDIAEALDFYERLFGRDADARPMKDVATRRNARGRRWQPAIPRSPNGATRRA